MDVRQAAQVCSFDNRCRLGSIPAVGQILCKATISQEVASWFLTLADCCPTCQGTAATLDEIVIVPRQAL